MTPDLHSLPLPHFLPSPHGSWVVPAVGWSPVNIWDLVGTEPPFSPIPTHGPRTTTFLDTLPVPRMRVMDLISPAQMAYFDPCYFTAGLLPHSNNGVAVLPTIQEERPWFPHVPEQDAGPSADFRGVGVQTSDDEWECDASLEGAAVTTNDYEGEANEGFIGVGVQTGP